MQKQSGVQTENVLKLSIHAATCVEGEARSMSYLHYYAGTVVT